MARKTIIVVWLIALVLASFRLADAQQPKKVPRIGFVSGADPKNPGPPIEAFQQELRDSGYVDRKNLVIEYRYVLGMNERSPAIVAELVQLNVDVLVVEVHGGAKTKGGADCGAAIGGQRPKNQTRLL